MTEKLCKKCGTWQLKGRFCENCGQQLFPDVGQTAWILNSTIYNKPKFDKWTGAKL